MNRAIAVSGVGSASAAPDVALVDIGVEVQATSVAVARSTAAAEMASVVGSLRQSGLQDADLTTTSYTISPEYDHRDGRRLRGYRVANMIQARIKEIESIGEIIDAASAGADHAVVRGLRFAHQDEATLASRARETAWSDAKTKAEQLAQLAGVELGPVVAVAEHRGHVGGPPMRAMAMESAMAPPIESGELAVTIRIEVEFSLPAGS